MTKQEFIKRYGIEKYEKVKEHTRIKCIELYYNSKECKKRHKEYDKKYKHNDLNSNGKTKDNIRCQSRHILFIKNNHIKMKDYEIHHCFGYDDPRKFIYIHKSLHNCIHQFLRDNNIDASTNHYNYIVNLINDYDGYTYVSI